MKLTSSLFIGALALASIACDNDPAKGKVQATVSEAAPAAAATAAAAPSNAVTYSFSQAGSSLEYVGAKVTAKHEGKLGTFSGKIQLVEGDPSKSTVTVDIDVGSITSDTEKLTKHLKSADFFHVEKFPQATFKSTSIKAGGEGATTHVVSGNLELRGVTKQITFPATIKTSPDSVQVTAEFAINRKDFGIVYPGMANDLIKDEVLILLKLDAKKG